MFCVLRIVKSMTILYGHPYYCFNSLTPSRYSSNYGSIICKLIIQNSSSPEPVMTQMYVIIYGKTRSQSVDYQYFEINGNNSNHHFYIKYFTSQQFTTFLFSFEPSKNYWYIPWWHQDVETFPNYCLCVHGILWLQPMDPNKKGSYFRTFTAFCC